MEWVIINTGMNKLLELFKQRSDLFQDETALIFEALKPILDGIVDFLRIESKDVAWESVELIDDIVVLIMKCDTHSIDPETGLPASRLVTIGVPFNLAATATSKDQVIQFLANTQKRKGKQEPVLLSDNVEHLQEVNDNSEVEEWLIRKAYSERKSKRKKELH